MLSPEELTVGTVQDASPGSIVLPRGKYESVVLSCEGEEAPVAVFLWPQDGFCFFEAEGTDRWGGVIVPNIRIELDETSLYNPGIHGHRPGVLVREGPKLSICGTTQHSFGRSLPVTVKSGLPGGKGGAAFTRWQVVVGQGDDKRVLHKVDLGDPPKE